MKQNTYQLKQREKEIIDNLLRFRYLERPQIQTMLNHKSKVKVIDWLNNLTQKQFIFKIYTKEFAGIPSIYCLDNECIPYLKEKGVDERIIKRTYAEKTRSQTFQDKSIFIADIYLNLKDQAKKDRAILDFYTQTDLRSIDHLLNNLPHAYFSIKDKNNRTKRYFIEVFDPQPPRMWLRERIKQYIDYFESEEWQDYTDTKFPKVILVAPDEKSKNYLKRQINKLVDGEDLSFYLTTWEAVQKQEILTNLL